MKLFGLLILAVALPLPRRITVGGLKRQAKLVEFTHGYRWTYFTFFEQCKIGCLGHPSRLSAWLCWLIHRHKLKPNL